jgi:hypothetical protein
MMLNRQIFSVNVCFNQPFWYDQFRFSQNQLVMMIDLGTEWLHYQPATKHEFGLNYYGIFYTNYSELIFYIQEWA